MVFKLESERNRFDHLLKFKKTPRQQNHQCAQYTYTFVVMMILE